MKNEQTMELLITLPDDFEKMEVWVIDKKWIWFYFPLEYKWSGKLVDGKIKNKFKT